MSPARRVLGYLRPYAARYGAGVGCLALATGFSLGIPWQVKEAVDGGGGGALAFHAGVIVVLAALHALARLGSRFMMLGAGQWVDESGERGLTAAQAALIREREEARRRRDWATADAIRDRLLARGVRIKNRADGTDWSRVE